MKTGEVTVLCWDSWHDRLRSIYTLLGAKVLISLDSHKNIGTDLPLLKLSVLLEGTIQEFDHWTICVPRWLCMWG